METTVVIEWAEAWKVSGMGFGLVFLVLALLAIAIWLIGVVLRRMDSGRVETTKKEEEQSPPEAAE